MPRAFHPSLQGLWSQLQPARETSLSALPHCKAAASATSCRSAEHADVEHRCALRMMWVKRGVGLGTRCCCGRGRAAVATGETSRGMLGGGGASTILAQALAFRWRQRSRTPIGLAHPHLTKSVSRAPCSAMACSEAVVGVPTMGHDQQIFAASSIGESAGVADQISRRYVCLDAVQSVRNGRLQKACPWTVDDIACPAALLDLQERPDSIEDDVRDDSTDDESDVDDMEFDEGRSTSSKALWAGCGSEGTEVLEDILDVVDVDAFMGAGGRKAQFPKPKQDSGAWSHSIESVGTRSSDRRRWASGLSTIEEATEEQED